MQRREEELWAGAGRPGRDRDRARRRPSPTASADPDEPGGAVPGRRPRAVDGGRSTRRSHGRRREIALRTWASRIRPVVTSGTAIDADHLRARLHRLLHGAGPRRRCPRPASSPTTPSVLFTIAGMVPFKPFFLGRRGRRPGPGPRRCRSASGPWTSTSWARPQRHCTFFEMLGNFSFGDYFKAEAIPFAWELVTEVLGHRRRAAVDHRPRVRRRGRADLADAVGRPRRADPAPGRGQLLEDGGHRAVRTLLRALLRQGPGLRPATAVRPTAERSASCEIWNLVFMQYNRAGRRHHGRPAPTEHRHRSRARADPPRAPGRGLDLRHRPLPAR